MTDVPGKRVWGRWPQRVQGGALVFPLDYINKKGQGVTRSVLRTTPWTRWGQVPRPRSREYHCQRGLVHSPHYASQMRAMVLRFFRVEIFFAPFFVDAVGLAGDAHALWMIRERAEVAETADAIESVLRVFQKFFVREMKWRDLVGAEETVKSGHRRLHAIDFLGDFPAIID